MTRVAHQYLTTPSKTYMAGYTTESEQLCEVRVIIVSRMMLWQLTNLE